MSDIEFETRKLVGDLLGPSCDCFEESPVQLVSGHSAKVDVLCRPHSPELRDICFGIEVKAKTFIGDSEFAHWVAQSASYVGAISTIGLPAVPAMFLWVFCQPVTQNPEDVLRINGMRMLAQHLRVGVAIEGRRGGLTLVFGPSCEVYNVRVPGGWRERARERFLAKRISGGVRRTLPVEITT